MPLVQQIMDSVGNAFGSVFYKLSYSQCTACTQSVDCVASGGLSTCSQFSFLMVLMILIMVICIMTIGLAYLEIRDEEELEI